MNRTTLSGQTGRVLNGLSGNWETKIIGRIAHISLGKYFYVNENIKTIHDTRAGLDGQPIKPDWYWADQAYSLDGPSCRELADALINVTDEQIATIRPETHSFVGTSEELKHAIRYLGRYFKRLKNGYKACN